MASVVSVNATNNPEIDGLLGGTKWSGTISYSFPTSPGLYVAGYGSGEPSDPGFATVSAALQSAVQYAIGLISSYTNVNVVFAGSGNSDIMVAQSPVANPTSYTYLPDLTYTEGGDSWFGTNYDFSQASFGNYYFMTALHELGHSFGLKHSDTPDGVANVAVPTAHDDLEYTVMSYRSYVGAANAGSLTNEDYGYSQTYMANDILAMQTLYGANYSTHSENTVYTWSATTGQQFINGVAQMAPGTGSGGSSNRIFETVWDGNGIDTYDFSNYTTALTINLNPGAFSITSATQLAYLGDGHYASGNIYNAYLINGDARSYIDNAIGGSENDTITGNAIANVLNGGGGNDTLIGEGGNDTIIGGAGTDVAVFSGARANYQISYNSTTQTFTVVDHRGGTPDGTDTVTGVENFRFSDGTFASSEFNTPTVIVSSPAADFDADGKEDILWYRDDGTVSIWDSGQIGLAHWISGPGAIPSGSHIARTGDFNGDGRGDILWRDDNGSIFVWDSGQPSSAHTLSAAGIVSNTLHVAGTGDFDGNGRDDILWRDDNGSVFIWDNGQASGAHTLAAAGVVPTSWHVAGVGDFDGNGKSDILWHNDNGAVSIWDNGQIANAHIIANAGVVPTNWHVAEVGDFDGNGKSDLLWHNDNGAVSIWDNGQVANAHIIANARVVPASWHVAGVGDFDGNRKSDILWHNDNGAVSIWDNGQIGNAHILATISNDWHIA